MSYCSIVVIVIDLQYLIAYTMVTLVINKKKNVLLSSSEVPPYLMRSNKINWLKTIWRYPSLSELTVLNTIGVNSLWLGGLHYIIL